MTTVGTEAEGATPGKISAPDTMGDPVVRMSRAVQAPPVHVWEVLVSPAGSAAFLGEGAVLGGKGEPYHCADGTSGCVRSYHPLEQLRVSWHPTPDSPPTIVELDLRADGDGATRLELSQNHLWHGLDADDLDRRWSAGLDRLAALAESGR
jgi:uncharacterized protein YndB with AHSA1/START domain